MSRALATNLDRLGTETAFTVLARAKELEREGRDVIHLEIGEPDFSTPRHVVEAAAEAIARGHTHYCPAAGVPELREAAASYFARTRKVDVNPANVLVATGAKPFLFFTILATCDPGDEVIYPDPGFPIYASAINWSGAIPVPIPLREDSHFGLDIQDLSDRLTGRTKLVILNSPNNPTGAMLGVETLRELAQLVVQTDCWVLADEIYSQIVYGSAAESIVGFPGMVERTILVDGLSKTYAMTGWRCGFAGVPAPLVEPLTRFFVNSTSCVPPFVQLAGVAALEGPQDEVAAMLEEFADRRTLLVDELNKLPGIACDRPEGAFYTFPNVGGTGLDADVLAGRLLDEAGVAVLSGAAFGDVAKQHLRLSYANSIENLERALERMETFLNEVARPE